MHAPTGPTHTPATSRAASVSHIKLGGGLFRLRSASSAGVVLRGLLAGFLAGVTVRSPPTLSASRTRLGFFAVSLRRKLRRFCMPTIAESTLTSSRLKSPGRPHAAARSGRDQGEIGTVGSRRSRRRSFVVPPERRGLYSRSTLLSRPECAAQRAAPSQRASGAGPVGRGAAARAAASDGHFEPAASLTPAGWLARRVAWSGSKTWSHGTRSTCTGAGGGVQTGRRQRGCKGVCRMHGRAWAASDPELPKQRQRRALLHLVAVHLALVLEREPGWPHASKAERKAGVSRCGARAAAALEPRGPRHARTRALQAKRSALPLPGRQGVDRAREPSVLGGDPLARLAVLRVGDDHEQPVAIGSAAVRREELVHRRQLRDHLRVLAPPAKPADSQEAPPPLEHNVPAGALGAASGQLELVDLAVLIAHGLSPLFRPFALMHLPPTRRHLDGHRREHGGPIAWPSHDQHRRRKRLRAG